MPRPSAHIHEAICAGVAPSACAAWNTITAEAGEADQHGDEAGGDGGEGEVAGEAVGGHASVDQATEAFVQPPMIGAGAA